MLNLRIPGYELSQVRTPSPVMNLLVPVILGSQLFRALDTQGTFQLVHHMPYGWLMLALALIVMSLGAYWFVRISGAWTFESLQASELSRRELFNYVLIPLIFAFELGHQLEALLTRSGSLIPDLGRKFGLDWGHLELAFSQGWILFWQTMLILTGMTAASMVLKNLAKDHQGLSRTEGRKRRLPLLLLSAFYLWSFFAGAV